MNNFIKIAVFWLFSLGFAQAQVAKTSIVEHFTNSNCSVCASNNPSIRTTIAAYPNALHLSFYPSSPYASCFFSMQNPTENDARTNHYGLYGGTPQLALNGAPISRQNLDAGLMTAQSQTSNFSIVSRQTRFTTDSVRVRLAIKKVANDATTNARLFIGVAEDTITRTTGNGETKHYNVFRKALTATIGTAVFLPSAVGDSLVVTYDYKINSAWNAQRLNAISILQKADKTLLQAHKSPKIQALTSTEPSIVVRQGLIFPNPAQNFIFINKEIEYKSLRIADAQGRLLLEINTPTTQIDISAWANGIYFLTLQTKDDKFFATKFIK